MTILNWITEHELDQLKRRGWIEQQREPQPNELRILLLTLWHPRQAIGEGDDRHQTAVQAFRSLPLDRPVQLALFDGAVLTLVGLKLLTFVPIELRASRPRFAGVLRSLCMFSCGDTGRLTPRR